MEWYNFIMAFFAGGFIANMVPHIVHGISGNKFPTPFAKPRGIGLSSPTLNVFWSLFNFAAGWVTFISAHINQFLSLQLACFAGFSLMALILSKRFQSKHRE